ncbi:hypothetical protein [Chthoniobacter flavus]|nr:hypothetical protein [Chthoniobacter flavus]
MKTKFFHLLVFGVGMLRCAAAVQAEPALAGHDGLAGQTLDADGIKAVLMGKKITLGGMRVVIVMAKAGGAQDAFLQSHIGMTTSQFQNYWRRLFMTGGGTAPKIFETESDARKFAAETPGAIVITDSANARGLTILAAN